ncbi:uncharacterized protein [Lolium perenne]|uniref:uncharacterized protein n=1 Tax=Lolium perenne TaxID=4522 RepID=UPI003A99E21E
MPPPERPLELDDLLEEILLRLPPRPSSLPRASLVCARWRRIISNPQFLKRFRAHHRTPQLLGLFVWDLVELSFISTLDPPDCIPAARFSMPRRCDDCWRFHGCRHGLVVLITQARDAVIIWDTPH